MRNVGLRQHEFVSFCYRNCGVPREVKYNQWPKTFLKGGGSVQLTLLRPPPKLSADVTKFIAPCGFGFIILRVQARVETRETGPQVPTSFFRDCGYRRVGEKNP